MKRMRYTFLTICIGIASVATAQIPDSLKTPEGNIFYVDTLIADPPPPPADSVVTTVITVPDTSAEKRGFLGQLFKEEYPNPKAALFLSAVVPGAGQIYNKSWWKLPFVYGGYAALIYAVRFNTDNYRRLRDAYILDLQGLPHEFSDTNLDADDLRRLRDQYDKNKQLSYIGIFALHLVQTAEAFVDCHLKTFDVSDDLSIKVVPAFESTPHYGMITGIGLRLHIK